MPVRRKFDQLSCRSDPGLPRYTAINDIVNRALASVGMVFSEEPHGLDREDGRRPDDMTLYLFKRGRRLLLEEERVNTSGETHLIDCSITAGAAVRAAELREINRYSVLGQRNNFVPRAVETTGALG